jgi:hypothetical protein
MIIKNNKILIKNILITGTMENINGEILKHRREGKGNRCLH